MLRSAMQFFTSIHTVPNVLRIFRPMSALFIIGSAIIAFISLHNTIRIPNRMLMKGSKYMYDCNLIKSRAQKMQDNLLPSLESTYLKMQMPMTPGMQMFPTPATPTAPIAPAAPTAPAAPVASATPTIPQPSPEQERTLPINPLLPRVLPVSPNITVPANPLLPPDYATTLDYESLQYLNGYLRTQIGKYVKAEFLVGSTNIAVKYGKLTGVGLNYILIENPATGDVSACDFYNIKFFTTHAHGDTAAEDKR